MHQLLNLKKPTTEDQIKFVRQMQTETLRVIKTSEMLDMLKAIEENLIGVKIWNRLFETKRDAVDLVIGVGKAIDELVKGLKEAKGIIKDWHNLKQQDDVMWDIYDRKSPEMVRLNTLLKKYESMTPEEVGNTTPPLAPPQGGGEKEVSNG